jgi:hypothetical protein
MRVVAALLAIYAAILLAGVWWQGAVVALGRENGVAEWLGLVTFVMTALWLAWTCLWLPAAAAGILTLRELDFHDWFFEPGLLHADLLTSDAPVRQKAVGLTVALTILAVFVALVWRGGPVLWRAVRARAAWAMALVAGTLLGVVASQLDGIGRRLEPFGIIVPDDLATRFVLLEEILELGFAVCLLFAASQAARRSATA